VAQLSSGAALILRHIDYGEADRIVTFLTPEQGLMKGFARAARKSRKRFGASLEPFSRVNLSWSEGRGALCSLRDAELIDARTALRADLRCFALACYGVELTEIVLHDASSQPEIYLLLNAYLDHLVTATDTETARLLFEVRLVQLLGYIPHLLHCSDCFGPLGTDLVVFDVSRGGSLCDLCSGGHPPLRVQAGTLGSLARSLRTPVDRFAGFRFGETTLSEGRHLIDSVLALTLSHQPKSLDLIDKIRLPPGP